MTTPTIHKTEYHVYDETGEAMAWEDTLEEAMNHVHVADVTKIVEVTYYFNDSETVWERDE